MSELLATISADELAEWAAYSQIDPFGSQRGDLQAAIVASTVANVQATKGHRFPLSDFLPTFGPPAPSPTMTPQEIHDRLSMMFGKKHG